MSCSEEQPVCALVVGHRRSSQGAVSADGRTEWSFNRALAKRIKEEVEGVEVVIVYRDDDERGYTKLPAKVNDTGADAAIAMHFNSFEERPGQPEVSGSEMLYWQGSEGGQRLADLLLAEVLETLNLPNRGLKPTRRRHPDGPMQGRIMRGSWILMKTAMPCVLAEPFFGDNPHDWQRATERMDLLASAYARAIEQYAASLT